MHIDKNPKHWKFLVFYHNPDESRLFVAKMTGLSFPFLNFAKPMAWPIAALTLAIVTILAIVNNVHPVH
jgi:uncharacterized membrane protein